MINFERILGFFILMVMIISCKNDDYKKLDPDHELFGVNGYVGAGTCIECHKEAYDKWIGSHHDLAMQIANDSTVLGNFDNIEAKIDGVKYLFYKENNQFFVRITEINDSEKKYRISYTFGVTPLQQYLIDFENGKKQVLRATWDTLKKEWFHQYKGDAIEPDDWLHWTNDAQNWNTMCAECHSTNLEKNYSIDTDSFNTTYSEINVSCESCHGPAKNHNIWAANDTIGDNSYIIKGLNQNEQLNLCAPCHARRAKLTDNLEPGESFENQYLVQNITNNYYHRDGQIMEEDYVYGSFLQSKMYANGVMCSNCHDPHSLELKFQGNTLCIQCHIPNDYDTKSHHFHLENTEASLCINCHMTGAVYMGNDFRRDHSFRIPRPDQSEKFGTPNACIQCHNDKNNNWASNAVKNWYGNERKEHFSDKLLVSGKDNLNQNERRELEIFIVDFRNSAIARATVIENLNFSTEEHFNNLMQVLSDSSPNVRYHALMKFRLLSPQFRTSIALKHMNDSIKLVRIGAAQLVLGIDEDNFSGINKTDLNKSLEEFENMLFANADFSTGRMQLGDYYFQKGNYYSAIDHYKMALKKDSLLFPVYSNLATTYSMIKDYTKAKETLDIWIVLEPKLGRPHFLKALLNFEMGDDVVAVSDLKLAIKLDPNDTRSMYNLATYYYQDNKDLKLAESYAKKALRIEPDNQDYKYLLALIYQNLGQTEKSQRIMLELNSNQ
ncbi:MAG: multiheme c-type cytochrome [Aureibaculum sp.]|nr:multiheme c-type cytochrome [Aureibaculum sp.]